jgi:hypothetical protein
MTHILTQEAFDTLSEFLYAVNIVLIDPPCAVGRIRRAGFEFLDALFDPVIHRYVGNQIFDGGKGSHGLYGDGLSGRKIAHTRHAHELGFSVDLGRTRAAFSRFAIPAHSQIVSALRLDLVNGIQDDHAFGNIGLVLAELAARGGRPPNIENRG